jgi:ubiquinone/menaquinone biosynthesis C-methylase UbiE
MTGYWQHAGSYDYATAPFNWLRRRAVEQLRLQLGATVIDVGCGTGLCFPYLQRFIGAGGHIIAIDASEPMLVRAAATAARNRWRNITFVHSTAQDAPIAGQADAALFCAVHDILRCSTAVKNVLAHVRAGGRVVAAGGKWPAAGLWPLHLLVAATHGPYVTSLEGFDRPWALLLEHCPDLRVEPVALDTGYLAAGSTRPEAVLHEETAGDARRYGRRPGA